MAGYRSVLSVQVWSKLTWRQNPQWSSFSFHWGFLLALICKTINLLICCLYGKQPTGYNCTELGHHYWTELYWNVSTVLGFLDTFTLYYLLVFQQGVLARVSKVQPTQLISAPHPWNCTLCTVHYELYTMNCTLITVHSKFITVHCTLWTVQCTLYTLDCTVYSVHCGL